MNTKWWDTLPRAAEMLRKYPAIRLYLLSRLDKRMPWSQITTSPDTTYLLRWAHRQYKLAKAGKLDAKQTAEINALLPRPVSRTPDPSAEPLKPPPWAEFGKKRPVRTKKLLP